MAYRGNIATLPIGLQGFNGSKNASRLGPGHFSAVEGVDIDGGVLIKDGGAEKLNAIALGAPSKIIAGINWSPAPASNDDIVLLSNGQMRKDTGAGTFPTLLTTIVPPVVYPASFCRAGGEDAGSVRKLFMFQESDQVQVVLGTAGTAADISTPAADWTVSFPIFGVQHVNRVWAGGNASQPHRIYYSNPLNHQDFTGSGSGTLNIYPGEGEQLVGGISFRGLLILFKYPKGIYLVDTRDAAIANWRVDRLTGAIGAANHDCIVQISNDILICDSTANFHLMSSVNDFSDISTSDIGRPQDLGPFVRSTLNLTAMRQARGAWYPAKSKAWFMVPLSGGTDNDLRILVDFNEPQVGARYYLSRRDTGCSLWMRPDSQGVERPTLGDDLGFVWLMDEDARNKDGAAYSMTMDTSENDFGFLDPQLAPRTKNGQYIEIVSDIVSNYSLTVIPSWDNFTQDPIVFTIGSPGAVLGSFILDTDVLSAIGTVTTNKRLEGQGRKLKLSISNENLDEEVRLAEIRVAFQVADERLREV
jgi:hypothetical protein